MEITDVEAIVLESAVGTIPLAGGKGGDFDATVSPIIARIHTDEGITGIGETFVEDPSMEKARWVGQSIRGLSKHLNGRNPLNVRDRWHEMYVHTKRTGSYLALSAIDEALWDIKGKNAGQPVYELLGGSSTEVNAYATFPHAKEIDELIDDSQWLAEKGFDAMKIVVGSSHADSIEHDRRRIREVSENSPDHFGVACDANTSYSFIEAMAVGRTASEYELEWFEEPISHTDIPGQAELNDRLDVPISGYQTHKPHYPARDHLEAGALEIYQPTLDLCGGITAAHSVAVLVEAFDKRLVPHTFGPGINYSASLQVAEAATACDLIEFVVFDDEADDPGEFVASPYLSNQDEIYVQDGGRITPPPGPGLGVELDESAIETYRID